MLLAVCDTKRRLLGQYDAVAKNFSKAVEDLTIFAGSTSLDKYMELKNNAEQLRSETETARLALDGHISKHKC